jgi:hypothetical protein
VRSPLQKESHFSYLESYRSYIDAPSHRNKVFDTSVFPVLRLDDLLSAVFTKPILLPRHDLLPHHAPPLLS